MQPVILHAFVLAFYRAVISTPRAKWRRAHFGKTHDQIPSDSLDSLGSVVSAESTGPKHERQLALPTLRMEIAERDARRSQVQRHNGQDSG